MIKTQYSFKNQEVRPLYYKLNEYISLRGWEKLPYAVVDKRRR